MMNMIMIMIVMVINQEIVMAAKRTTACLDNDNCDDKYNADDDNIDYFDDD